MNSFSRFGIDHLSPSSLNTWRTAPGIWALRYIAKITDKGNPSMWRGNAVENGLRVILMGKTDDERLDRIGQACTNAFVSFDMNSQGESTDEIEEERSLIGPMLHQCSLWKSPGPLNAAQLKVEHSFDPIPIPVIGYIDMAFDGIDIDLKTTKACPSAPRPDHVRQVSLYRAARGRAGGVLYVTAKRHAYFDIDDESMETALEEMRASALSLQNFLARMENKQDVLRSLPVDWESWQAPKIKVSLSEILLAG